MAFSDKYFQVTQRPRLEHVGANFASWVVAELIWFGASFLTLHAFGWWALAFPPWVLLLAAMTPVMVLMPVDQPFYGFIATVILWIATGVMLVAFGLRQGRIVMVSVGIHTLLPIIGMVMAFWAVSALLDGKIPGSM